MNKKIVSSILKKCMGYKSGEEVLLVCDDKLHSLGYEFYQKASSLGIKTIYTQITPLKMHGQEPPALIGEALKKADIAILLTSMSLSHTKARKSACHRHGTRIASLPGVTKDILKRSILINYSSLARTAKKIESVLTKGRRVEIHTDKGSELSFSIKGRRGFSDDGLYAEKGAFGNLPAGEVCIGPLEGTTNGRLVVDGSCPFIGRIRKPIEIIIKNGYATKAPIDKMKPLHKAFGKSVFGVAEFGIGLNPKALVTGCVLEDEKAKGTCHIAFGNNKSFGGRISCPVHLDFVFLNPKILIDGNRIQ